jgi:hypothetical protein
MCGPRENSQGASVLQRSLAPAHGKPGKLGPVYANPPVPRAREVRLYELVEQRLAFLGDNSDA